MNFVQKLLRPTNLKRFIFFLTGDIVLSLCSLYLSYNLRFNFAIPSEYLEHFFVIFLTISFLKISALFYFKMYQVSWRFFSFFEAKKILLAHIVAYLVFSTIFILFKEYFLPFPRSVIIIDFVFSFVFISSFRFFKRFFMDTASTVNAKRCVVVGVNSMTYSLLRNRSLCQVEAVVDNSTLVGSYLGRRKIEPLENLPDILRSYPIEQVVIAEGFDRIKEVYEIAKKYGIEDIGIFTLHTQKINPLSVKDLLARRPKDLDSFAIKEFIKDKTVLVSGAGGSIGSELCRQCKKFEAKRIIALENSEFNLYQITEEISDIIPVMCNVVDSDDLRKALKVHKPDIILHAAAYKHVPLVEENIDTAIKNNIIGTKNIIDFAVEEGISKVVLISTDKAVRPTNVMGATKRICELYAQNRPSETTEIVAVRFGNVLGSSGSVIPKFQRQIDNGGPVTVTHPEITRYFMLIEEACALVLQAAALAKGGEIFILDMGEPVKIVDLAKKMIELSGRKDIDIKFTGLRPGEKLYEELLINDADRKTKYQSIMVAGKTEYDIEKLNKDIDDLLSANDKLKKLKEIVPEFNHK